MLFSAEVVVATKPDVADPQGQAIEAAIARMPSAMGGGAGVASMRAGKVFRFAIEAASPEAAEARVRLLADRLLANHNTESFAVRVEARA
jgi:phosphoribosylformylglycinamidine synthase PurS subunit